MLHVQSKRAVNSSAVRCCLRMVMTVVLLLFLHPQSVSAYFSSFLLLGADEAPPAAYLGAVLCHSHLVAFFCSWARGGMELGWNFLGWTFISVAFLRRRGGEEGEQLEDAGRMTRLSPDRHSEDGEGEGGGRKEVGQQKVVRLSSLFRPKSAPCKLRLNCHVSWPSLLSPIPIVSSRVFQFPCKLPQHEEQWDR